VAEVPLKNSVMHLRVNLKHSLKDEESVAVAFRPFFLELSGAFPTHSKYPSGKGILHGIKRAACSEQTCKSTFSDSKILSYVSAVDKHNC